MNPTDTVDRYFAHMRSRDLDGLASLFTDEAAMILPDGREVAGLAAIRGMYQHIFGAGAPSPTPLATIAGPNGAATEIEARLPDGTSRRTANFFHLDADGRIARLSIYKRGDW
ncbi:nuclear transport factor 2 family protein [Phenylobacterium sp. LjRoot219]|uniref:nuclear transport factor 2 family protein n=1 Tax=Phenylobacterium sp. LjRoot219 TaxID=3342283 RepID=UPI003ED03AA7